MLPNACPKPLPTPKAPKRLNAINTARKKENDLRAYGPPARRKLVTLGPCAACGSTELCDNAHVLGNDGAGRKQGYKTITSLCRPRPERDGTIYQGCHSLFDTAPDKFRARFPHFNAKKAARETQRKWLAFLASAQTQEKTP